MQLIVEPESTLDIDLNMSSVDNIQHSKNDDIKVINLDIDDLNDKKCNGNKLETGTEANSEVEEKKKVINEIDDNEAEMSNVDLSEIINKQNNNLKIDDTQIEESHEKSPEKGVNGLESNTNELMNIDEASLLEEDYLEDDIISISAEPFKQVSLPEIKSQTLKDEKIVDVNTLQTEKDKFEVKDDKGEPLQFEEHKTNEDDVVEVIEDTDNTHVECSKNNEPQTHVEKDASPIRDSKEELSLIDKKLEQPPQEEIPDVERELDNSTLQSGNVPASTLKDNDDEVEIIDESENSPRPHEKVEKPVNITEDNDNNDVSAEPVKIICENTKNLPEEELEHDDIEIIEEIDKKPVECEHATDAPNSEGEGKEEAKENSEQLHNLMDLVIDTATENTSQHPPDPPSNLPPKAQEHDDTIEDPKEPSIQKEDRTDSPTEELTADSIKSTDNVDTNKTTEISSKKEEEQVSDTNTSVAITNDVMDVDERAEDCKTTTDLTDSPIELKDDMEVEEIREENRSNKKDDTEVKSSTPVNTAPATPVAPAPPAASATITDKPIICKLSNTLDILSDDDEEELPAVTLQKLETPSSELLKTDDTNNKQCIDIEDDDDIMVIDEDTNKTKTDAPADIVTNNETAIQACITTDAETSEKSDQETSNLFKPNDKKETTPPPAVASKEPDIGINIKEKTPEPNIDKPETLPPLIPENFVKTAKKKLSDMTRDEIEEFCILKIVESIVDRSSLSDIKNKLKVMTQGLEEYRKKAMMLTKQNRDLQVVLKSVQEEQKKVMGNTPITPLKITRSVGMQVFMEKSIPVRKKGPHQNTNKNLNNAHNKNTPAIGQGPRPQKQINQAIPVPRLVPANSPALKTPSTVPQISQMNTPSKNINQPNGVLISPTTPMKAEKRPHSKVASSVTVDLTDDEPPLKMPGGPRTSPAPPVRLVPPQNLMGPQRQQFATNVNSPRKVYIPISGPQNQALRPGQTIMLKTVPTAGMRPRGSAPHVSRVDSNPVRMQRIAARHPAPLPIALKQYQPPNWKVLPPAPDLKLSKVENGIVISWKIEDVSEDSYEEIASYQIYAYQETSIPPCTTLWKKIGDVKALPLPMACTLTQFMAGFKYYFAVRAVDIRSRLGPFSLPGSIILLNKNI